MAQNFSYRENRITKMSIKGILNADDMTINVDDIDKSLTTLLSDFNGAQVNIIVKVQEDIDLDDTCEAE